MLGETSTSTAMIFCVKTNRGRLRAYRLKVLHGRKNRTLERPRLVGDREKVTRLQAEGDSVRMIATKLHARKLTVNALST